MALLKYALNALLILSTLCGLNIFAFDTEIHRFHRAPKLHTWAKLVHSLITVPALLLVLLLARVALKNAVHLIAANMEGTGALSAIRNVAICMLIISKYGPLAYVAFICLWRWTQLQELLNDFAKVYDQYVALFGYKFEANLYVVAIICCKIVAIDAWFWIQMTAGTNYFVATFVCISLVIPGILVFACFISLTLLVALFRGSTLATTQPWWQARLRSERVWKLIKFYNAILRLCGKLEAYLRPFVAAQLAMEIILLVLCFSVDTKEKENVGVQAVYGLYVVFLIYPTCLSSLCHDIGTYQRKLANELLTLECEYVVGSSSKLLELFCLQKNVIEVVESRSWRVLHIRRGFVLRFVDLVFINVVYIHTIYITSNSYHYRRT